MDITGFNKWIYQAMLMITPWSRTMVMWRTHTHAHTHIYHIYVYRYDIKYVANK